MSFKGLKFSLVEKAETVQVLFTLKDEGLRAFIHEK